MLIIVKKNVNQLTVNVSNVNLSSCLLFWRSSFRKKIFF